ncbi:HesA/MoeB/ThiF family protein [Mucilaginibacter segetis]|uniref:Molybdopterin-synthase adenylyltransferase n=1 Tax=Mucilaginibacter segetis TaxID=2793071 RepID=A0A934UMM3_9SPHI|nr:HesA/MoeB/ThiF family protein [Mucilaginibacter segetis]MBK0379042.1 HesA/MoeB/ThiF family protein [Mucilaginibacter segetis]
MRSFKQKHYKPMHPDLLRYSCQMALPGFNEAAQLRLQRSKVLVVGAGGLGCPAAQYLAACGVGMLGIADYDTVSVSNLHRQILYNAADVGLNKANLACERLSRQNPSINIIPVIEKITSANVIQLIDGYDIIVDCTDNFETCYLLNDAGVISNKPVIYGAIYQYEGQVAVWNVLNNEGLRSPNYRDLFPQVDATKIPNCAEGGVIPTLAGIIGCMQANEVIKLITGNGDLLTGKVLIFDALTMQSRIIGIGATTKTNITALQRSVNESTITFDELQKELIDNDILLIDVRSIQERDLDDIGGIHIPLDELGDNLQQLAIDKTLVFYCATGKRSAEAVKLVQQNLPHIKAFSLQGGIKDRAVIN